MALRYVLTVAAALAGAGLATSKWLQNASTREAVGADRVDPSVPLGVGALGRVEPSSRIHRLSHPGGLAVSQVARLLVREGDIVSAGDVVAIFADAEYKEAATAQAAAALALARATLTRVMAAGRAEEIEAQRARILALRAVELSQRRDAERAAGLVPSGASGAAAAERAQYAAQRAAAERSEAEAILERMLRPRPEDLAVAQAELATAAAALRKAEVEAAMTRVIAPISGTVLKIHARPGEIVGLDGLLELGDLASLDIVADVFETDLPRVRAGAAAEVIVPGEERRFGATVREIGRMVRRTTQVSTDPVAMLDARTFEVRLHLSEEARIFLEHRINLQVQVSIKP
jgi:HlyD family secretion protein